MISKCFTRVAVVWAEMLVSTKQNEPLGFYAAHNSIPWEQITQALKEYLNEEKVIREIDSVVKKNSDMS